MLAYFFQKYKLYFLLLFIISSVFFLALSFFKNNTERVFVLDVSTSMLATDSTQNLDRLTVAKKYILSNLGEKNALLIFTRSSQVLVPLTDDTHFLKKNLSYAAPELLREQGSDIVQALKKAERLFLDTASKKELVLLSDGGETAFTFYEPDPSIDYFIKSVGTEAGAPIPEGDGFKTVDGELIISRKNTEFLHELENALDAETRLPLSEKHYLLFSFFFFLLFTLLWQKYIR